MQYSGVIPSILVTSNTVFPYTIHAEDISRVFFNSKYFFRVVLIFPVMLFYFCMDPSRRGAVVKGVEHISTIG